MNSLMGNNQAMSNAKQKAESTGVFSLHPSPAPRLCVNSSSPVGVAKHRLILCWEDCRITTSFYFIRRGEGCRPIGILPYYYFLLLEADKAGIKQDWKTAVLLLPSTYLKQRDFLKKIGILPYYYTSFYSDWVRYSVMKIGILPYYYFLLLLLV